MAKAMLIMDMPSSCLDCPCSKFNPNIKTECRWQCAANGMELSEIDLEIERPIICPLREAPRKKEVKNLNEALEIKKNGGDLAKATFEALTNYGYNACIDEILGGGE